MSKIIAKNRKAFHDYEIIETIEAGIVLTGTEIKSIRNGRVQLKDGYVQVKNGQATLLNTHISPFEHGNIWNVDPERPRKLLMHKRQITKWENELRGTGLTVVPLDVHLSNGKAKLTVALARGRKNYDKREVIKKRDQKRSLDRLVKG